VHRYCRFPTHWAVCLSIRHTSETQVVGGEEEKEKNTEEVAELLKGPVYLTH